MLKESGIPVTIFGAKDIDHSKLNNNLGVPGAPATVALFEFLDKVLKP